MEQQHSVFLLQGPVQFGPFYAPSRLSVSKERDLSRQGNFCGGEDVTDLGGKNRDVHVSGRILASEVYAFEALLDNDDPLDLTTAGWSGEVMVKGGEYEGPVGTDPVRKEYFFTYSLDLVSTGIDEPDGGPLTTSTEQQTNLTPTQLAGLSEGEYIGL
jgi:hypothetical protein